MLCNQLCHSMKADIDYLLLLYFSLDTELMWQASTSIIRTTSDISPGNSTTHQVNQAKISQLQIPVVEKRSLWDGENNILVREEAALIRVPWEHSARHTDSSDSCLPGCPLLPSLPQAAALVGRSQQFRAGLPPDSCFSAYYLVLPPLGNCSTLLFSVISNYWAMLPNLEQANLGLIHASIRENVCKRAKGTESCLLQPHLELLWLICRPHPHGVRDAATIPVQNFTPKQQTRESGSVILIPFLWQHTYLCVNPDFILDWATHLMSWGRS